MQMVGDQQRQALEHRPSLQARRAQEIPFGIRAIQSGIEVDGVWISGSNTPAQSSPASRAPSIMLETDSSKSARSRERPSEQPNMGNLEAPRPALRQPSQPRYSVNGRESLPSYQTDRSPNRLSTDLPSRGRPTYQPRRASGLRYSQVEQIDENDDALNALEGRRTGTVLTTGSPGMPAFSSTFRKSHQESKDSESRGSESLELLLMPPTPGYLMAEQRPLRAPRSVSASSSMDVPRRPGMVKDSPDVLLDPAHLPPNQQRFVDANNFEALGERRRSQVAEEGQLLRRYQAAEGGIYVPHTRVSNTGKKYTPVTSAESDLERQQFGEAAIDPFATPYGTPMGSPKIQEEPPSFASFVNSTPPIEHRIEPLDDSDTSPTPSEETSAPQGTDSNRQTRQSQIVRKVNSGFEILRAGTLNQPQQSYSGDWNHDLEKGVQGDANVAENTRGQKKLQKARGGQTQKNRDSKRRSDPTLKLHAERSAVLYKSSFLGCLTMSQRYYYGGSLRPNVFRLSRTGTIIICPLSEALAGVVTVNIMHYKGQRWMYRFMIPNH